ncbi:OST3/OST6 family protein [Kocuria palustris]|nr:OST3/OST6 family protein [Kocuria palustris]
MLLWWFWLICVFADRNTLYEKSLQSFDNIIQITNGDFSDFSGPRDYFSLVVFTSTDPAHGCRYCMGDLPRLIGETASLWKRQHLDDKLLFFTVVDLADASNFELIEAMGMNDVPHVWLFRPSDPDSTTHNNDNYGMLREEHIEFRPTVSGHHGQLELMNRFLTQFTGKSLKVQQSFDSSKFLKVFLVTFVPIIIIKKFGARSFPAAKRKHGWLLFLLLFSLVSLSGYQFTMQRGAPFVAYNENGVIVISGGQHYQFGAEIIIITALYAALAASLIALIWLGNYKATPDSTLSTETAKSLAIIITAIIAFLLYSLLTSIILRKDHGYPYGLIKLI